MGVPEELEEMEDEEFEARCRDLIAYLLGFAIEAAELGLSRTAVALDRLSRELPEEIVGRRVESGG